MFDETPIQEQLQYLTIASWIVTEEQHLIKINLGTKENVQLMKVNFALKLVIANQLIELLKNFKDVFV